jgi:hypothetical protein
MEIDMIGVFQGEGVMDMLVAAGPGLLPNPRATSWFDRGELRAWFGFASMNAWGAIDAIACNW